MVQITIGREPFDIAAVQRVVAGYAFGACDLEFDAKDRGPVGDPPSLSGVPRWAYRSFDCVPADPAVPLDDHDLMVAAGLNGRLDAAAFLGMRAVAGQVSDALAAIPLERNFWDLPAEHVRATVPPEGSEAWWLWRAWWLMMGVPGVKVALTHKTLHHKRPSLVPLLDNETVKRASWKSIHSELQSARAEYDELEAWFAQLAKGAGGVPLTRLRIHDIVLWCSATGDIDEAEAAGTDVLHAG